MLSKFAKLLLTLTAIAPVLLTYSWVAIIERKLALAGVLIIGCVLLVLLCIALLCYANGNLERMNFEAVSVEVADRENMAFLLLYLLPLFTDKFANLNWHIWIPAMFVFGAVVATGYAYHFNPLLGLLGWHFYKVGTKEGIVYVLITKKQLRQATETVQVGQLTEYIVIDFGDQ